MTLFERDLQASRFRHRYLDEPDEHISVQEIEVSVPTRKRRISDDLSEEDSNSVSLVRNMAVRSSPLNYEKKQTKVKELTKMLKVMLLVPISFFLLAGRLCSGGF